MAAAPAKPPEEVPAAIKEDVAKLQKPLAAILVGKEIPWLIQAALGASGYVTVEDLADRWNTPGPGIPGWREWIQPDLGLHGNAPPSGSTGGSKGGATRVTTRGPDKGSLRSPV